MAEWSTIILGPAVCDDCHEKWPCECGSRSSGITSEEFVPREEAEARLAEAESG